MMLPPANEDAPPTYELKYVVGDHQFGEILAFERKSGVLWYGDKYSPEIVQKYPTSGEGLKITAVEIIATQTTNVGTLVVTRGGPGFRNVEFTLRAFNTYFWTYNIKVFGKIF
ncbi:uncharacterized protein LOC115623149 [Scaptodrosophila lebanonensis]|uniref:Uncharacterized protein LOC115623149 n=1 Tax=Drosophila lebanonensis TaxID=7225 RepID=A0A6J2TDM1_DROLE|nr:uncharacterized protein LOC115623149 [Scaptodrosophila lebanonensis]